MRGDARKTVEELVERHYPDCLAAVWGGSASRAEANPNSDLDLIIIDAAEDGASRKTTRLQGWIVEIFVLTPSTYRDLFDEGIKSANPTLQRMLAEGVAIKARPEGLLLIEEAREDLRYGPMPWSSWERDHARYTITEYMEDLQGAGRQAEVWFSAHELAVLLCRFVLRVNGQWVGEGKHLYRRLGAYSPETAKSLEEALEALYAKGERGPLLKLGAAILAPYGGPLLEGYEA